MATGSVEVCNALRKIGIKCGDSFVHKITFIYVDVSSLEASYVDLPGYNDKGAFEKLKAYMDNNGYKVDSSSGTEERECSLDASESEKCKVYIFKDDTLHFKARDFGR